MSKNRIYTTLTPYHCKLVKCAAQVMGISESKVVAEAVRKQFESLPQSEREGILNRG